MCMTFLFINPDPNGKYRLIILNNRDEFLDRPTEGLAWRDGILGGIDLQDVAKGTWMAMNRRGRIGILLAITQPEHTKDFKAPSRGKIPIDYLRSPLNVDGFCENLQSVAQDYNGFQLLAFERKPNGTHDLYTMTNLYVDQIDRKKWAPGVHCFGNSPPHVPLRKVVYGKKRMEKFIEGMSEEWTVDDIIEGLMEIATDRTNSAPDAQLALQIGWEQPRYSPFCSIFVRFPPEMGVRYGTRSHSIVVVDNQDNVTYYEKRMATVPRDPQEAVWTEKKETFQIRP